MGAGPVGANAAAPSPTPQIIEIELEQPQKALEKKIAFDVYHELIGFAGLTLQTRGETRFIAASSKPWVFSEAKKCAAQDSDKSRLNAWEARNLLATLEERRHPDNHHTLTFLASERVTAAAKTVQLEADAIHSLGFVTNEDALKSSLVELLGGRDARFGTMDAVNGDMAWADKKSMKAAIDALSNYQAAQHRLSK